MSENRYLLNIWPQGRIFKKLINLKTMETKIDELVRYYRKITELTVFNGLYKEQTGPNAKFIPSEAV